MATVVSNRQNREEEKEEEEEEEEEGGGVCLFSLLASSVMSLCALTVFHSTIYVNYSGLFSVVDKFDTSLIFSYSVQP